jgi:hypothetical protein
VKTIRFGTILLSALLLAFAACEYLPFMAAPPPPPPQPSATPTPTANPTPTPTATPVVKKRRRRRHPMRTPMATPAGSPTPIAQATPIGGTAITTGESDAERKEIERSIKRVEAFLATVNRARLGPQDSADYDRIKSFVADGRSALKEQDDLRARSLVDKAARLASQLAERVSGQ